jgi:hypothetical protein
MAPCAALCEAIPYAASVFGEEGLVESDRKIHATRVTILIRLATRLMQATTRMDARATRLDTRDHLPEGFLFRRTVLASVGFSVKG